jgi:hypothetical protein
MDAATPDAMTTDANLRPSTDADLDSYTAYIAKLAAIASPGDPPVTPFRAWFYWQHGQWPATFLVDDHSQHITS